MGAGIIVCGLNGCGKSTLGKALADCLGYRFIDIEDLYFPTPGDYSVHRDRAEVEVLLLEELKKHEHFVLAAVKGDFSPEIQFRFTHAALLEVPRELRLRRVYDRSFQKFGERILPGGDLHQQEKSFQDMVAARPESFTDTWVQSLNCPVVRLDGTKPIGKNISVITKFITNAL